MNTDETNFRRNNQLQKTKPCIVRLRRCKELENFKNTLGQSCKTSTCLVKLNRGKIIYKNCNQQAMKNISETVKLQATSSDATNCMNNTTPGVPVFKNRSCLVKLKKLTDKNYNQQTIKNSSESVVQHKLQASSDATNYKNNKNPIFKSKPGLGKHREKLIDKNYNRLSVKNNSELVAQQPQEDKPTASLQFNSSDKTNLRRSSKEGAPSTENIITFKEMSKEEPFDSKITNIFQTSYQISAQNEKKNTVGDPVVRKKKEFLKNIKNLESNSTNNLQNNDIFDFFSEPSQNEDKEISEEGVINKLIKQGKAKLVKHKKVLQNTQKKKTRAPRKVKINKTANQKENHFDINNKKSNFPDRTGQFTGGINFEKNSTNKQITSNSENAMGNEINVISVEIIKPASSEVSAEQTNTEQKKRILLNTVHELVKQLDAPKPNLSLSKRIANGSKSLMHPNTSKQSTPLANKSQNRPMSLLTPIGNLSPWRVEDENTPRFMYYAKNSSGLPSFSSDVVLSDTKKYTPKSYEKTNDENISRKSIINISNISSHNNFTGVSEQRTPLRPINAQRHVYFPKLSLRRSKPKDVLAASTANNNTLSGGLSNKFNTQEIKSTFHDENSLEDNLFGFDGEPEEESSLDESLNPLPNRRSLTAKLKNLKRLLPEKPKPTRISRNTVKTLFTNPPRQSDIRQMLSSTMVDTEYPRKSVDFHSLSNVQADTTDTTQEVPLFEDLFEPETSLDTTMQRKTYQRTTTKRKRPNYFVLFSDDDEQENVEPKKRQKRTKKEIKELNKFYKDFNSMCDRVDQYKLLVTKESDTSGSNLS